MMVRTSRGPFPLATSIALIMAACGSANLAVKEGLPRTIQTPEGMLVEVLPRDAGGALYVSLWIDAGAADASPGVATLAAFAAAMTDDLTRAEATHDTGGLSKHDEVTVFVTPTGTEIGLPCEGALLDRCLDRLARVLSTRELAAEDFPALQNRLQRRARQARATPGRRADSLALRALLGKTAALLDPLGVPHGEAGAIRAEVASFLADHYGPNRALLVLAGHDVRAGVEARVSRYFSRAPRARLGSSALAPRTETRDGMLMEPSDSGSIVSVVALVSSVEEANGVARDLHDSPDGGRALIRSFAVGDLFFVSARRKVTEEELERAVASLVYSLRVRLLEGGARAPTASGDPDLVGLARESGYRFTARGSRDSDEEVAPRDNRSANIGLGILVGMPRFDRDAEERESAYLEQMKQRLESARRSAIALTEPTLRGTLGDTASSVALENGARLEVRQKAGGPAVIAVRFDGGVIEEPKSEHGRTALLAEVLASTCGARARAHHARFEHAGMRTEANVDADGFGFTVIAEELDGRALDLLLACVTRPVFDRDSVDMARLRLLSRMRAGGDQQRMTEWAALAAAAHAPGLVAPLGSPTSLAAIGIPALQRAHRTAAVGARISVAAITPEPADETSLRMARRLAALEPGARAAAPSNGPEPGGPIAMDWNGTVPRVVVTFGAVMRLNPLVGRAAGEAFATVVAKSIEGAGLKPVFLLATASARGVYAAVALDVAAERLDELPDLVQRAAKEARAKALERAETLVRSSRFERGSRRDEAQTLARERLTPRSNTNLVSVVRGLATGPIGYAVGLPEEP